MVKEKCPKLNEFLMNLLVWASFEMKKARKIKKYIFWFITEAKIGNIWANIGKSGFFPKINWERGQK